MGCPTVRVFVLLFLLRVSNLGHERTLVRVEDEARKAEDAAAGLSLFALRIDELSLRFGTTLQETASALRDLVSAVHTALPYRKRALLRASADRATRQSLAAAEEAVVQATQRQTDAVAAVESTLAENEAAVAKLSAAAAQAHQLTMRVGALSGSVRPALDALLAGEDNAMLKAAISAKLPSLPEPDGPIAQRQALLTDYAAARKSLTASLHAVPYFVFLSHSQVCF